ncbi:PTS system lactose/cellobiose family transporter subunit IIC [Clostridium baratii]|nr:PTS transporter subunit EIIC [Clostridium baratii]MDU1052556.1 PTS transporter subunit EIIC [Clostridium baratii]CUP34027.1 PTS system lactose/cellobiose family transporter subunit IIC [Clostridium baratii]
MNTLLNKFSVWLEKAILPVAEVLGRQRHLGALRDGIITLMPVTMVGAIVVLLKDVIFTADSLAGTKLNSIAFYAESVQPVLDKTLLPVLNQMYWGTLALGIIFTVFTISYNLAGFYEVDKLSAGVIATISYLILTPTAVEGAAWGTLSWTYFNSEAMFTGIIVAFLATEIFRWVVQKGWTVKMPSQVPPAVSKAFSAIIPAAVVFTIFGIIAAIFLIGVGSPVKEFINQTLQKPLTSLGQSPVTIILLTLISQVLWFFGLHGSNIVGPVLDTLYSPALQANQEAILIHNTEPVHAITRNIIDIYGMHGGSGSTLALVIALMIFSKRQEHKELTKLVLAPSIFQINEPVIYGLPIVLDPIFCIPFILVPTISVFIGWFFTAVIPIAGYVYIAQPWVTPPVISAFIATGGSIGATVIAACTFIFAIVAYIPFVMLANKQRGIEE